MFLFYTNPILIAAAVLPAIFLPLLYLPVSQWISGLAG